MDSSFYFFLKIVFLIDSFENKIDNCKMNSKIISNITKIVIFFILLFSFFSGLINLGDKYIIETKTSSRWYAYKQLSEETLDILFMGNSRSFCSIDPRIIDDLLGTNSFVLGISAESIITTYYELKEALKTQSPQYVVLESFILDQDPSRNKQYYKEFTWNTKNPIEYDSYIRKVTDNESDSILSNSYFQNHNLFWKQPYLNYIDLIVTNNQLYKDNLYDQTDGFLPRESIINLSNSFLSDKEISDIPYEQNIYYFQKFVELCKKNEIELIVITSPTFNNSWLDDLDIEIKAFDKNIIENNVDYVFSPSNDDYKNSILFSDGQHLSIIGAIKFSIDFSQYFSDSFSQKINQGFLKNYSVFLIDEIVLTPQKNDTLFFQMKIDSLPNKRYLYIIYDDGSVINQNLDSNFSSTINNFSSIKNIDLRISNQNGKEIRVLIPIQE